MKNIYALLLGIFLILFASPAWAALGTSVTLSSGSLTNIYPGQVTQLEISISNSNSSAPIQNVAFVNTLPAASGANGATNHLHIQGTPTYTCYNPATSSTSAGVGTLTVGPDGRSLTLANGIVPARSSDTDGYCTILVPVTARTSAGAAATYTFRFLGGSVTGNDGAPVSNTGEVSQSINIRALTRPNITVARPQNPVVGADPTSYIPYEIIITNNNPTPIPGFNITQPFPTRFEPGAPTATPMLAVADVNGAAVYTSTCTAGGTPPQFTPVPGETTLTITNGTLPPNGSCRVSVRISALSTFGEYTSGYSGISVNPSNFTNDIGIAATSTGESITTRSPLDVRKYFIPSILPTQTTPRSMVSGTTNEYVVVLTNAAALPLTVSDFVDNPSDGTGALAYGIKLNSNPTITCTGTGTPGTAARINDNRGFELTSPLVIEQNGGTCTITASITGTSPSPGETIRLEQTIPVGAMTASLPGYAAPIVSNTSSSYIIIADTIEVKKTRPLAADSPIRPGDPVRYEIEVINWTNTTMTNAVITDPLPDNQRFVTGTINGVNYTPQFAGNQPSCSGVSSSSVMGDTIAVITIGSLGPRVSDTFGRSCKIRFWAMTDKDAVTGDTYNNVVPAGGVCANGGADCTYAPSNISSGNINSSLLTVTKGFSATTLPEGTVTRMTVTLSNFTKSPMTNVEIEDLLPTTVMGTGQMRVATPANEATTCGAGTLSLNPTRTEFSLLNATIPARADNIATPGTCTFSIDVIAPAGSYSNTVVVSGDQNFVDGTFRPFDPITSAAATITYSSSLNATKSFAPSAVSDGGRSRVTIRLQNNDVLALSGVTVTDPLPSGMLLASPVNAASSCAGTPSFTGSPGDGSITMTGANLLGNSQCDIMFDVDVTGTSNWVNTIPVGNIVADGGIISQNVVSATLTNTPLTSVTLAKTTSPGTLTFPGQISQLVISITNGATALNDISLTDYFTMDGTAGSALNGMKIASVAGASTTCPGAIVQATPGATFVQILGGNLAANASCTATVNVTSTSVGGITNYIPPQSLQSAQGVSNTGTATTSLSTQSNIGLVKQFTPKSIKSNEPSRLRLTFYNPNNQNITNISVDDVLPAGLVIAPTPNATSTCLGAIVTAPASNIMRVVDGELSASVGGEASSCYAEINVTSATEGTYTNTINAGSLSAMVGGSTTTNSESTTDLLYVKEPFTIHKAFSGRTLDAGNPLGLTTGVATATPGTPVPLSIALRNPNNTSVTMTSLTDALPAGMFVALIPNATTSCTNGHITAAASSSSVTLSNATIAQNSTCHINVDVVSNVPNTYTNTIPAGTIKSFEDITNSNSTSAQLKILAPPGISKQFDPVVITPGATSRLTIFLDNPNDENITLTSILTDTLPTLPGQLRVAATPNMTKTCPGTVTAAANAVAITYASGAIIPPGGCQIEVNVTGSTNGSHNNNIPINGLRTSSGNNQMAANATLGIGSRGYISGKFFADNNVTPDGIYQPGVDTPVANVTIELRSGATCSGTLLQSQNTNSIGDFLFSNLDGGAYSLCQVTQPTTMATGITTAGTIVSVSTSTGTPGTATDPSVQLSQITNIIINDDGTSGATSGSINNNFAKVIYSTLSGIVFTDINNDGVMNGADAGISGQTIQLLDGVGTTLQTATTSATGAYSFSNLSPGTYSIRQPNQPPGTTNGRTIAGAIGNGGTAGTPTDPATLPSVISGIILPPNTTGNGNNFAEIPEDRSISGRVFMDFNNNNIYDGTDIPVPNHTMNLTGTDVSGNTITRTTQTGTDGIYTFAGLPAGTYTIIEPAIPNDSKNKMPIPGTTGGTGSMPTNSSSQISGINLTGTNTDSINNQFPKRIGGDPDLTLSKTHSPTTFGEGSTTGSFTLTPNNIGTLPSEGEIAVVDTLPTGLTLAAPASGTGWVCTGAVGATTITCRSSVVIATGTSGAPITIPVRVAPGTAGQTLMNTAEISGGGEPPEFENNNTVTDSVLIVASARISGTVWHDTNHNRRIDPGEARLAGWEVQLLRAGSVVATQVTGANGTYVFEYISPGTGYSLQFREQSTGILFGQPVTNENGIPTDDGVRDTGTATNPGTNTGNPAGADLSPLDGVLHDLVLLEGDNIIEQSLPVDPAGIVYDSVTRAPLAGAQVTISGPAGFNPSSHVVGGTNIITTAADGFYQFLLVPGAPSGVYTLAITSYPGGYLPAESVTIPACTNTLAVDAVPDPAEVHSSAQPPVTASPIHDPATCPVSTGALAPSNQDSTQYYFTFNINASTSGNVVNNHIPLDPVLGGALSLTKTSPFVNVSVGQLVPYIITARNLQSFGLSNLSIVDTIPAGFKYKEGSANIDGVKADPTINGRNLSWGNINIPAGETRVLKLMLMVGTGVQPGEYVNTAQALNTTTTPPTSVANTATATVRVIPDPVFDCSEIIGKVFDDKNMNGYQDNGEPGIPNVRIATLKGWLITSDAHGRFSVACADIPDDARGSNFLMKLDERTLPTGYRMTTENPRAVRLTKGKMVKLNFGAAIQKVIRIDMTDDAFVPGTTKLRPDWLKQIQSLPKQFKSDAVIRLGYTAGANEPTGLGQDRLIAVGMEAGKAWKKYNHTVTIETELIEPEKRNGGKK